VFGEDVRREGEFATGKESLERGEWGHGSKNFKRQTENFKEEPTPNREQDSKNQRIHKRFHISDLTRRAGK